MAKYIEIDTHGIVVVRGDTQKYKISARRRDGTTYVEQTGDVYKFTVAEKVNGTVKVELEANESNDYTVTLAQADTSGLLPAMDYVYDVELQTADGERETIIPRSTFLLLKEVTPNV